MKKLILLLVIVSLSPNLAFTQEKEPETQLRPLAMEYLGISEKAASGMSDLEVVHKAILKIDNLRGPLNKSDANFLLGGKNQIGLLDFLLGENTVERKNINLLDVEMRRFLGFSITDFKIDIQDEIPRAEIIDRCITELVLSNDLRKSMPFMLETSFLNYYIKNVIAVNNRNPKQQKAQIIKAEHLITLIKDVFRKKAYPLNEHQYAELNLAIMELDYVKAELFKPLAAVYIGMDKETAAVQPAKDIIFAAIVRFDRRTVALSVTDIKFLNGSDRYLGALDYIVGIETPERKSLSEIDIVMRRYIGLSLNELLTQKKSREALVNMCLTTMLVESFPAKDVPFLLGNGFLNYYINSVVVPNPNLETQEIQLTRLKDLVYYIEDVTVHNRKYTLSQADTRELEKARLAIESLEYEVSHKNLIVLNNPPDKKEVKNSIQNYYKHRTEFNKNMTLSEMVDYAINDIASRGKLTSGDLNLLIGKGKLYYHLIHDIESRSDKDPKRTNRMAAVYLLADIIKIAVVENPAGLSEADRIFYERWDIFNKTFNKPPYISNWLTEETIYQRYNQAIREKNKTETTRKSRNIRRPKGRR